MLAPPPTAAGEGEGKEIEGFKEPWKLKVKVLVGVGGGRGCYPSSLN